MHMQALQMKGYLLRQLVKWESERNDDKLKKLHSLGLTLLKSDNLKNINSLILTSTLVAQLKLKK